MNRATHTCALLEVSAETYDEIRSKLEAAGYDHVFLPDDGLDMHGIALTKGPARASAESRDDADPPGQG